MGDARFDFYQLRDARRDIFHFACSLSPAALVSKCTYRSGNHDGKFPLNGHSVLGGPEGEHNREALGSVAGIS